MQGVRKGIICPSCGKSHVAAGHHDVSVVPSDTSLMQSLQRLELNPAVGGLLLADNVKITQQQIGSAARTAVFLAVVITQKQQLQVQQDLAIQSSSAQSQLLCHGLGKMHCKTPLWCEGKFYKLIAQPSCMS